MIKKEYQSTTEAYYIISPKLEGGLTKAKFAPKGEAIASFRISVCKIEVLNEGLERSFHA